MLASSFTVIGFTSSQRPSRGQTLHASVAQVGLALGNKFFWMFSRIQSVTFHA
jgi:hypothetical protein